LERKFEREPLRFKIERLAGGIAERKIAEQKTRRADMLDNILGAAHDDRRNSVRFEMTRGERHALVADGTIRNEDRGVDLVRLAAREKFRRVGLDCRALAAGCRQAEEIRRDFADATFPREA